MTLTHTHKKNSIITTLLCAGLTGCLSTIKNQETSIPPEIKPTALYQLSKVQWQQSAFRPNDIFNRYELKLMASIKWEKRSDSETYKFEKIKFSITDDPYSINLLHPQFMNKMACGWYCEYLDQPITQPVLGQYTMLDKIYEGKKPELLNFYDSLKRLNDKLLQLKPAQLKLMPNIIAKLSIIEQEFDTLEQVTGYLNDYFDEVDFNANLNADLSTQTDTIVFSHQPKAISFKNNEIKISPHKDLVSFSGSDPDAALLASFKKAEKISYKQELIAAESPINRFNTQSISPSEKTNNKLESTVDEGDFSISQFICSFQDNYFGEILSIQGDVINVALKGQAKKLKDGKVIDAQPGILFEENTEFSYLQLDENKNFTQNQILDCNLSGF
jgi:hypothetical protein